jgi:hypothetical protein
VLTVLQAVSPWDTLALLGTIGVGVALAFRGLAAGDWGAVGLYGFVGGVGLVWVVGQWVSVAGVWWAAWATVVSTVGSWKAALERVVERVVPLVAVPEAVVPGESRPAALAPTAPTGEEPRDDAKPGGVMQRGLRWPRIDMQRRGDWKSR